MEAHYDDETAKNGLCGVVPLPDTPLSWLTMQAAGMLNQYLWSREPDLQQWIAGSRLDGFTAMSRGVDPADDERMAVLRRFGAARKAAGAALPTLLATTAADDSSTPLQETS